MGIKNLKLKIGREAVGGGREELGVAGRLARLF
jgi:hypothetical protein